MMAKRHKLLEGHIEDPPLVPSFGNLASNIRFIRTLFLNSMETRNFLDFSG